MQVVLNLKCKRGITPCAAVTEAARCKRPAPAEREHQGNGARAEKTL